MHIVQEAYSVGAECTLLDGPPIQLHFEVIYLKYHESQLTLYKWRAESGLEVFDCNIVIVSWGNMSRIYLIL